MIGLHLFRGFPFFILTVLFTVYGIFPTDLTMHCHKWVFHIDGHITQVSIVMFVEIISRQNGRIDNFSKKGTEFLLVPSQKI